MERQLRPGNRPANSVSRYARPIPARRSTLAVPRHHIAADTSMAEPATMESTFVPTPVTVPVPVQPQPNLPLRADTVAVTLSVPAHQPKVIAPTASVLAPKSPPQAQHSTYFDMKPMPRVRDAAKSATAVHRPAAAAKRPLEEIWRPEPVAASVQPVAEPVAHVLQKMSDTETPPAMAAKQKKRFRFGKVHLLYGMASFLFIAGIYVAVDGWLVNRAASEQTQVLAARANNEESSNDRDNLSEAKPAGTSSYKVAPDLPRLLTIPSINVSARVLQLGVKSDNSLGTPSNIYDTGWYTGSSKPTDKAGAILIDGHVSGPTKHGVFYDLKKLKAGAEISLEQGDGQKSTFVVTRVTTVQVENVDMGEMMQSDDPNKLGLNLITCGGLFDAKTNEFKSRVLVFAVKK